MADNVSVTAGIGTSVAADDISSVYYQRVKLSLGADGSAVDAIAGNGVAGTGVQRVTIASDSTGVVGLATGTNTIGALTANQSVNVAQMNGVTTSMGTGVMGTGVQRVTIATDDPVITAINATNAQLPAALGVQAATTALAVVEPETVVTGSATANGSLSNFPVLMDGYESAIIQITSIGGGATFNWEWSNDGSTVFTGAAQTISTTGATQQSLTATATGIYRTAKLGRYLHIRISSYTSGTPAATVLLSKAPVPGNATVFIGGSSGAAVVGLTAHDAAATAAPVRVAGRALTANYTAVATGDTADLVADITGSLVVLPYGIPDISWQYASAADVTDTTSTEMKGAVASTRNYLTSLTVSNTDATVGTYVNVLSAATVIYVCYVPPQTASTAGSASFTTTFPVPLRGGVNEAINFQAVTTSAQLRVSASGFAKAA